MKKKLILFDWGNIVESHTTGYTCPKAFNDVIYKCGYRGDKNIFNYLGKYRISSIKTIKEFENVYNSMSKELNLNKSYKEFIDIYNRTFEKVDYYKEVADYEKSLKDKCNIGILSNLTVFDKERLNKQVDLSQYDYVFLSFEMGLQKPDIEIYNKLQEILPFSPKDILFIDDSQKNIEAASKIGWNTFQATGLDLEKIKDKCQEFLNEDNK